MSRFKTVVRAAVAVMLISDAAAALCARRSVTAALLEWLYVKASGGGRGGAPFIMIGSTPFSPSEIAVLASPCILGVLLAVLYGSEITGFLAMCFGLFRHRHEAADSLPTLNMSADELFKRGARGRPQDPEGAGQGAPDGGDEEGPDPDDDQDGEYEGGWFDEEGWHDSSGWDGDPGSGDPGMAGRDPEGGGSAAQHNSKSAGAQGAGDRTAS